MKITVWFTNGEVRTFPKVKDNTLTEKAGALEFEFGEHSHMARIMYANVNFIEVADEE